MSNTYQCPRCAKRFESLNYLQSHSCSVILHTKDITLMSPTEQVEAEQPNLNTKVSCNKCQRAFQRKRARDVHQQGCGQIFSIEDLDDFPEVNGFQLNKSAFREFLMEYSKTGLSYMDLTSTFSNENESLKELIVNVLIRKKMVKAQIVLHIDVVKPSLNEKIRQTSFITTVTFPLTSSCHFDDFIKSRINDIQLIVDKYTERGSGWVIEKVHTVEV